MYALVEMGILNAVTAGALALVVLLISRAIRRPAVIHALWVLVLLKLVTPPVFEIPLGFRLERLASLTQVAAPEAPPVVSAGAVVSGEPSRSTAAADPHLEAMLPHHTARDRTVLVSAQLPAEATAPIEPAATVGSPLPPRNWLALTLPILLWIWLLGTAVWFLVQGIRIALFVRFVSPAERAADEIQCQARHLAATIGIRRAPQVWVLRATISPMLWAVGSRARMIFPAELLDRVDTEARATLLTHELAHYHRRDHWVRLLELVATGLFWWHPVVWIAKRRIEAAEEQCCDAWVVGQFPGQPRRYAEALLDTIDFLSEERPRVAPVASGLGQAPFLRDRIRLIMCGVAPKAMSGTTRLTVLLTAASLLPLGPQLFDRAIRRADAALESLELGSHVDLSRPARVASAAAQTGLPAAAGLIEGPDSAAGSSADELLDRPLAPPAEKVSVWAVVSSPDGRFQAVAQTDGGLLLRDTFEQRTVDLTGYQISSIAFAPHRDLLAAGSAHSGVYLFDCVTGDVVANFAGHQTPVRSVAFSLDGRFVASGSRDGAVKLWDIDHEMEVPRAVPAQASAVTCLRFSPDGRLLAIASGDWMTSAGGGVAIWDLRGGAIRQQWSAPSAVGAIAFDSGRLVVAGWDGNANVWDLRSGSVQAVIVDKDVVSAAAFASGAQSLLLAAADGVASADTAPAWFREMDRDHDGKLVWDEFLGTRDVFERFDVDQDGLVVQGEVQFASR